MGIEELVLSRAGKQGIEKGKTEVVQNFSVQMGLANEQISKVAAVTVEFVAGVRKKLKAK